MHDSRAGSLDRPRDLLRAQPAAQQARRSGTAAEQRRVALKELGVLAQMLAHKPEQIIDGALLAAAAAVAVMEKQDHARRKT